MDEAGLEKMDPCSSDQSGPDVCSDLVGFIAVGAALEEVQWLRALSVSGAAFVLSILTSLATGLPEAEVPALIEPPDSEN